VQKQEPSRLHKKSLRDTDTSGMKSFRTLRMVGSITALLAGLLCLALAWDLWDMAGSPLARFNPGAFLSWYGLGVIGGLALRIVPGVVLLWLFVRLGSSQPLPRLTRAT
jgi:hypothetical protein